MLALVLSGILGIFAEEKESYYLYDRYCCLDTAIVAGTNGAHAAFDGGAFNSTPWMHTVGCMTGPAQCKEGGYGLVGETTTAGTYGLMYRLDDNATANVLAYLGATTKTKDICVKVTYTSKNDADSNVPPTLQGVTAIEDSTGCPKSSASASRPLSWMCYGVAILVAAFF